MKGSSHLDWIAGFVIFLAGLVVAVEYAKTAAAPALPEEESVDKCLLEMLRELREHEREAKIYRVKFVNSTLKNYPCEIEIPGAKNISVVENLHFKKPVEKNGNRIAFLADWPGRVEILESELGASVPEGDAGANSSFLWNDNLTLSFNSTHMLRIIFKNSSWLRKPANMNTSSLLRTKTSPVKAVAMFDNANMSVDSFSSRAWIFGSGQNVTFVINFTEFCYLNETAHLCRELSSSYSPSRLVSFYNSSQGISFISESEKLVENVNNESIAVTVFNLTRLEIFFHEGNYSLALNESDAFSKKCEIKPYLSLNFLPYSALDKLSFEVKDFRYRVEILNRTYGDNLPSFSSVYKRYIPLLIYSDGILNRTCARVYLWR